MSSVKNIYVPRNFTDRNGERHQRYEIQKVYVLKEEENVVYIPFRNLMRPDMKFLQEQDKIAKRKGEDLLETLRDSKASNGRNGLQQVQNLIRYVPYEIAHYGDKKSQNVQMTEAAQETDFTNPVASPVNEESNETQTSTTQTTATQSTTTQQQPKKRGPGRPPKNQQTTSS